MKFTVIIPAYNHERYVADAIRSVLEQTVAPDSIVFFSDGSRDRTLEIARDLLGGDSRVRWLPDQDANWGVVRRMRAASELVDDGFVVTCAGDDVLAGNALEVYRDAMASSEAEWCIASTASTDEGLRVTSVVNPVEALRRCPTNDLFSCFLELDPWLPATSWCFSVALLRRVGGYRPEHRVEDYSLGLRLAAASRPVLRPEVTAYWRRHPTAMTISGLRGVFADHARVALSYAARAPRKALRAASRHSRVAARSAVGEGAYVDAIGFAAQSFLYWPFPSTTWHLARMAAAGCRRAVGSLLRSTH